MQTALNLCSNTIGRPPAAGRLKHQKKAENALIKILKYLIRNHWLLVKTVPLSPLVYTIIVFA